MKSVILIVGIAGLLFLPGSGGGDVRAQTPTGFVTPTADFTYHLQRFAVAGTNPVVYLWTIKSPPNEAVRLDGLAFKSLASPTLRKWVIDWQQGSMPITYITPAGKPDTVTSQQLTQELEDFAQFCRSRKQPLIIRPAQK